MKLVSLSSAALAVLLAAGFSSSALADPFAPSYACGPQNEGARTATENMDAYGTGYRYVYTCYWGSWQLTETWYCGSDGWSYTCTVV